MPKTMLVYANPYIHLDHRGWLGGSCPFHGSDVGGERRHVGAEWVVLSILKRDPIADPARQDETDATWSFSTEAVRVPDGPPWFYNDRVRDGELLPAGPDGAPPLEELARARRKAIADWEAAYLGRELDTAKWGEQFALDKDVADVAAAQENAERKAAEKAEAEAEARALAEQPLEAPELELDQDELAEEDEEAEAPASEE